MKKEILKKHSALIRRAALALFGILLGINVYLANAEHLAGNSLPMPFGFGAAVVLSGSMEPTLSVNDVIFVREAESYDVNDIVVFDDGKDMVVHRITAKSGDTVTTKGDANNMADEPIGSDAVKGKVVFSVPFIGIAVKALRSPIGMIVIILTAVLLTEGSFRRKKESDEAHLDELKEEIRKLKEEQDNKSE